eukprot:TRINITY_DN13766_c2_g1_i1.p1 TRINITY_DN13766_c2_g1~~TRINITY_DN13766_c2_g1_i1.p1  ORF type:complete len:561 (+),score=79.61 TRINITY_DN13766_c2_g1_i1:54-1736(+)
MRNRWPIIAIGIAMVCGLVHAEGGEEGESKAPAMMAATLLGSVAFAMSLFYAANSSDPDLRKYAYEIISSTIAIFCAVLTFQSANDIFEVYTKGLSGTWRIALGMCHALFWFSVLQIALAFISGAVGAADLETWSEQKQRNVKLNLRCFAILLAHIAGFASISAWGLVQQTEFFSSSPLMSFCVVPLGLVGQLILQQIFDILRDRVARGDDGELDDAEVAWAEGVEESENDVLALCCSYLMTQVIRFSISGTLPGRTGSETWEILTSHGALETLSLFSIGISMAVLSAVLMVSSDSKRFETAKVHRGIICIAIWVNMCFSWCTFYGFNWFTACFFKGTQEDKMLLGVVTAVLSCIGAAVFITILDRIADLLGETSSASSKSLVGAIVFVIQGMGIFIGFAWEQCFDEATESLSAVLPYPHLSKMGLTACCVVIVLPAWRWWILPMALEEGWRFGFVIDPDQPFWEDILQHESFHILQKTIQAEAPLLADDRNRLESMEDKMADVLRDRVHPCHDHDEVFVLTQRRDKLKKTLGNALTFFEDHVQSSHRAVDRFESVFIKT